MSEHTALEQTGHYRIVRYLHLLITLDPDD